MARDTLTIKVCREEDDEEGSFVVEAEHELPAVWVICDTCRGKGSRVNPSVDGHGISQEEFDEDPDFREAYFGGVYDVQCTECAGTGKVQEVDVRSLTTEQRELYEEWERARADAAREDAADRRTRWMEGGWAG